MGYVNSRKIRLRTKLTQVQTVLDSLYNAMLEMSATGAKSYKFDSGEGSQSTTRRDLSEIQDMIERYEATERHLINELYGVGLVNIQVRRKKYV